MAGLDETLTDQVRQLAGVVARDQFLELFDLKMAYQGGRLLVSVTLDKRQGSVGLEECTAVSRDLEKRLDELDLIQVPYLLEVSSPGLDRSLRGLEDCQRFVGRLAQFTFQEALEGQMTCRGRLGEVREGKVELFPEGGKPSLWVPFSNVKRANLVVEIRS
jgi:ribosome maturation factor RimP